MVTVPGNLVDANLFNVEGYGVEISYSKSSFAGVPQFSYKDEDRSLNVSGEEIRVEESELGALVTVTIEVISDLRTVTATLLVPRVNLKTPLPSETAFETVLIQTTHRTSIGGPDLVDGQLKTYKCLHVEGTAQHVLF